MIELKGGPVARVCVESLQVRVSALGEYGVVPKLAIVRVGEKDDDIWYEQAAVKRMDKVGVSTSSFALKADCSEAEAAELLQQLNANPSVHAILLLRPLPSHLQALELVEHIAPAKDVDGASAAVRGRLMAGEPGVFAPCTAEAVIKLLDYYGCELAGANVVVCGRSLVVGRALADLLLARDATVTVAHSKTIELDKVTSAADVVITAMGRGPRLGLKAFKKGAWAVDVATRQAPDGSGIEGDIDPSVAKRLAALSPVPGGVGPLTTAVLAEHVVQSAERTLL